MESAHDQAEAAIESLGGLDAALSGNESTASIGTPDSGTPAPQEQGHWTQQQRDDFGRWQQAQTQGAPEAPTIPAADSTFLESIDPTTLSPAEQERFKQMQADYTRKTQALAERSRQYDPLLQLGANPAEIQEALELRSMLQDPRNWVELHRDLTANLREMGLSPQEAHDAATEAMHDSQQTAAVDLSILDSDPELAPLKQYVEGLKKDVESVQGEITSWREAQETQQMEMAIVGEIQRSVNAIRQARPDYNDGDIDAIFELASYHDGDMFAAAQRYDQIFSDRMNRWMQSKQAAGANAPMPGAATITQPNQEVKSWDDARTRALEFAAQLDQQ